MLCDSGNTNMFLAAVLKIITQGPLLSRTYIQGSQMGPLGVIAIPSQFPSHQR